jgi:type IV pilus assembly protein PilX
MKLSNSVSILKVTKQRGVILVVALIMLLVMTAIGVTVMTGSTLQERMAGNSRQMSIAKANAESALKQAELEIKSWSTAFIEDFSGEFDSGKGIHASFPVGSKYSSKISNNTSTLDLTDSSIWASTMSSEALASSNVSEAPRFVIELIGEPKIGKKACIDVSKGCVDEPSFVFQITAIGYGRDENITAILQSIYTTGQG